MATYLSYVHGKLMFTTNQLVAQKNHNAKTLWPMKALAINREERKRENGSETEGKQKGEKDRESGENRTVKTILKCQPTVGIKSWSWDLSGKVLVNVEDTQRLRHSRIEKACNVVEGKEGVQAVNERLAVWLAYFQRWDGIEM